MAISHKYNRATLRSISLLTVAYNLNNAHNLITLRRKLLFSSSFLGTVCFENPMLAFGWCYKLNVPTSNGSEFANICMDYVIAMRMGTYIWKNMAMTFITHLGFWIPWICGKRNRTSWIWVIRFGYAGKWGRWWVGISVHIGNTLENY